MIYYAHCICIYDTEQEKRDIAIIKRLFPNVEILNPNNPEVPEHYKRKGMEYFRELIQEKCSILIFRALPNGRIPAGVAKEIEYAKEYNIPVIELPCYTNFTNRVMSVEDTRLFLNEIGYR
jgi:hypothetical protein